MKRPLPNTYWVLEGRFLAGEYPGGDSERDTRKRLQKLIGAGVDHFIDLTEQHEHLHTYRELLPPEVGYYSRPLPDHSVPSDPGQMREVQAALRSALESGRTVYVHCRAGIGRTGMAVGCWLIEQGRAPEEALQHLNELWKQNARSRRWPHVPETDAQRAYLLSWPNRRQAGATAQAHGPAVASGPAPAGSLTDRARGALLGLALGDATGASVGGDLPPGTWTDDTAMALCQADSLLAQGGVDTRDQAERYLRWLREGYRSATGQALGVRPETRRQLALAVARRAAVSGTHDPSVLDKDPLVRAAPAVIFHADDLGAAVDAAADAARVTHQAPVLVDACRLFAGMLHTALAGGSREEVLGHYVRWEGVLKPEVLALAASWTTDRRSGVRLRRSTILHALDAVVRAFASAPDFARGLDGLVDGAEDADVLGAAYGQLAGAWFGERGLPAARVATLVDASAIADLAEALLPPPRELADPLVPGRAGTR